MDKNLVNKNLAKVSLFIIATLFLSLNIQAQEEAKTPTDMKAYTLNGFELSGAEYWVFVEGKEFSYPNDVLWGFQGEFKNDETPGQAPELAKECALLAYNKLNRFYNNPPVGMKDLIEKGGVTKRFFLWVNDYTQSAPAEVERPNNFWHWNRGPKDYSKGYWKWESTLNKKGECILPEDAQINSRIEEVSKKTIKP